MKKIFVLSLILLMIFVGCSSSYNLPETSIYDSITYSYENLSFENIDQNDILYGVYDDYQDIKIMAEKAVEDELVNEVPDNISDILSTLKTIGDASLDSLDNLVALSSSDLNALATSNSITLTVEDIVSFNNLKSFTQSLIGRTSISKFEYLEYRLDRNLTSEEKEALNLLQEVYLDLRRSDYNLILTNLDFADLELEIIQFNSQVSDEVLDKIEIGFNLIKNIDS
jgi:hypothetical protein